MAALVKESETTTPARLAGRTVLACQSDERLVDLAREGHERAFDAIVDRYTRPLLRRCRRILPESRAEDAVQQTFLNAHTALMESDDAIQLKPWLYTIARNVSLNMLRQNGWNYEQIPADFDGVRRPDQVLEQTIQLEQTVSALNELPERQRDALVMREFEGRSYGEIAAVLGANDGAVRQLLNRARGTLRAAATALMPPPFVARMAASSAPPDGRRIVEIAGGLGAAGIAKAGATVLVAGSLVVAATEAPVPVIHHKQDDKAKATPAATTPRSPAKVAATAVPVPATEITRSGGSSDDLSGHGGRGESGDDSGSRHSGSSGDDDRSGSNSGSDDSSRSGSGGGEDRSGSDDRSGSSRETTRSGSDDSTESHSGSGTSGSGESTSGSDDLTSGSGTSGSGDELLTATEDRSGTSGSGTSGSSDSGSSGSGSDDPLRIDDD